MSGELPAGRRDDQAATDQAGGGGRRSPASYLYVRVFADGIEIAEQLSDGQTEAFLAQLRRLGVHGMVRFNSPCG